MFNRKDRNQRRNVNFQFRNRGVAPVSKQNTIERYSSIAKKRRRAIWRSRLNDIKIRLPMKSILITLAAILSILIIIILQNSAFNVKEITVIAPKEVLVKIVDLMESYKNRNIYLIRESQVSSDIKNSIPEIERVFLYKIFPDKLQVEAIQGNPVLILANLEEVQLFDSLGENLGTFSDFQKIDLTNEEEKFLKGTLGPEDDFFKNRYIQGKSDQEKLTLDWTKVPIEEKYALYEQFRAEVEQEVANYFGTILETHAKSVYNSLPLIQSYYLDELEPEEIDLAIALVDGISARGVKLVKNFMSTKFTLDLYSEENKLIRLSLRRSVEDQIKELDTIIYYGYFSGAKIIDLRSDTYSITR